MRTSAFQTVPRKADNNKGGKHSEEWALGREKRCKGTPCQDALREKAGEGKGKPRVRECRPGKCGRRGSGIGPQRQLRP